MSGGWYSAGQLSRARLNSRPARSAAEEGRPSASGLDRAFSDLLFQCRGNDESKGANWLTNRLPMWAWLLMDTSSHIQTATKSQSGKNPLFVVFKSVTRSSGALYIGPKKRMLWGELRVGHNANALVYDNIALAQSRAISRYRGCPQGEPPICTGCGHCPLRPMLQPRLL